jgi:hypothetical protein
MTTPATRLAGVAETLAVCQARLTVSPRSKPSTASVKALMKFHG